MTSKVPKPGKGTRHVRALRGPAALAWALRGPADLARALVGAKPAPARMAHAPLAGPLGERHLADEPRLGPVRVAGVLGRARRAERADAGLHRPQPADQVGEHRLGEPGSDVPGVPQVPAVVDAEQQGADGVGPRAVAGGPDADDDLLVPDGIELDPGAAPAR